MISQYETGGRLFFLNIALGLGTFIQILDISIANVSIPYIAGNLSVSAHQGTWVITSFAASNAFVLPLTGWLSDRFGRVHLFVWSVLLFAFISLCCGLSTSLSMLIFFRIVQGAVAGTLIPLSQALVIANNPPDKQGAALGFWGMIVIIAPILGPIIGGYLTDTYSWPWIFYINVPIGIFSATVTWLILKDKESPIIRKPIDWIGLCLLAVGVACLQIMLDKGSDLDWFESNTMIALAIISVIFLMYFGLWNYYQEHPIVDFSFFKNRNFTFGTICMTGAFLLYFSNAILLSLWLQTEQNYTAYWAGVAVAPVGIVPFFLSAMTGKYMGRFDLRHLLTVSFLLLSLSFFYQSNFTSQVSLSTIMLARFFQGFGVTIFFIPLVQLTLGQIPQEKYASASGVLNFIRILIGSGFGTSLSVELWRRLATFYRAHLAEFITPYRSITTEFYRYLEHLALPPNVVSRIIEARVEQQAFMLATNDIIWLGAWLFIALIPLLYLCQPVKSFNNTVKIVGE